MIENQILLIYALLWIITQIIWILVFLIKKFMENEEWQLLDLSKL